MSILKIRLPEIYSSWINMTYSGETLVGTGQAEDYSLKLSPRKASQQYEILNKKRHSDELN
ncbi:MULTISPECIES: hypothetical protein [Staphylococcus]|uniref:hypothetical protein n=1 Tax=Staphylococcus TaxID=1279 RepID=UPI00280A6BDF|nr:MULTISPECIES: hypothetical protein [Staphylococcus]